MTTSLRPREYLTEDEVALLIDAARTNNRNGDRDATMIFLAYRHGLRASELVNLTWSQLDLARRRFHVARVKKSKPSVHPLSRAEVATLKLLRTNPPTDRVFISERRTPMTTSAFDKLVRRAAKKANLQISVHPHMLRHACGYKLANDGQDTRRIQDYLGHVNIQHTVRYTELAADRFNGFWNDD